MQHSSSPTTFIEGIDLLEVNEDDKIATFTVPAQPLAALMALGQKLKPA